MGKDRKNILLLLIVAGLLFTSGWAIASNDFQIDWFTMDGGGDSSAGATYMLQGTLGQPNAGSMGEGWKGASGQVGTRRAASIKSSSLWFREISSS